MIRTRLLAVCLVVAAACSTPAEAGPRRQVITIEHSSFDPIELSFPAGTAVRFVVVNSDPIDHELIVGDEDVQDLHETGSEAHHGDRPGEITVPAGQRRTTTYTFAEPGTLLFGCHLPGHYSYGMKGSITITD